MLAELHCQREADVSKTHDTDTALAKTEHDDEFPTVLVMLASESNCRPRATRGGTAGLASGRHATSAKFGIFF
jgi:hypothetical protein